MELTVSTIPETLSQQCTDARHFFPELYDPTKYVDIANPNDKSSIMFVLSKPKIARVRHCKVHAQNGFAGQCYDDTYLFHFRIEPDPPETYPLPFAIYNLKIVNLIGFEVESATVLADTFPMEKSSDCPWQSLVLWVNKRSPKNFFPEELHVGPPYPQAPLMYPLIMPLGVITVSVLAKMTPEEKTLREKDDYPIDMALALEYDRLYVPPVYDLRAAIRGPTSCKEWNVCVKDGAPFGCPIRNTKQ